MPQTAAPFLPAFPHADELLVLLGLIDHPADADAWSTANANGADIWNQKHLARTGDEIRRSRVLEELYLGHRSEEGRKIAARIGNCQQTHWVLSKKTGQKRFDVDFPDGSPRLVVVPVPDSKGPETLVEPYNCDQRACPHCSREKSFELFIRCIKTYSLDHLAALRLSHIVFTIRNPPLGNLLAALKGMLKAFRQIRRSDAWKAHVRGYMFGVETTYNADAGSWHPHVHVLADADFWAKDALRDSWQTFAMQRGLDGNSYVKGVPTSRETVGKALFQCTKYVLKPFDEDTIDPRDLMELTTALRNIRMHGSGGSLKVPGAPKTKGQYSMLGGLRVVLGDPQTTPETRAAITAAILRDPMKALRICGKYNIGMWA